MNKSEIDDLREALMEAHIGDSSESLEELKYYNTPNTSPENTRPEAFAPISMGSQRPITGNKRSRSTSGLSLAELQKQLGHHSDSSDDEMKEYNLEKKKKRRTVKLRGKKRGGKRKRNRKKRTKRRGKSRRRMRGKRKGGHAGNSSSSNRQPNYEELAAMRNGNPHRVYYLYMVNTNYDPPLEQAIGNGFIHRFKYNDNGDKIAITGHPVNNSNSTAYTIPNPHHHTMSDPSAEQVLNFFYNPAQGARREFRDSLTSMMENLTVEGGRRKRRKMRGGEEYTLDTLYDFLSENSEETQDALSIDVGPILSILKGFKETSEKPYMNGSYYIMNIERNRADVINAGVVTEALQKGFNGSATNSFEHMSMMKTLNETTLLETFLTKDLPIIKAHYEFKPGAPGAVEAKVSFNAAKDQQSGGRKKRTRKRRKKRRKSRRKRKR